MPSLTRSPSMPRTVTMMSSPSNRLCSHLRLRTSIGSVRLRERLDDAMARRIAGVGQHNLATGAGVGVDDDRAHQVGRDPAVLAHAERAVDRVLERAHDLLAMQARL